MIPTDIAKILPSRKTYIIFVEHARVEVRNGVLEYLQAKGSRSFAYNIPYANLSVLLLGEGTSITRDAIRFLASQDVVISFTGGGGTPLLAASDNSFPTFVEPQSEYRPNEYMIRWSKMFMDPDRRLEAAKNLLRRRVYKTRELWTNSKLSKNFGLVLSDEDASPFLDSIHRSTDTTDLLAAEGRYAKKIYAKIATASGIQKFNRLPGEGPDPVNKLLDHANYLMYGISAVALHGMGIPFGMAVLHGKTRRGGLVFDIADLVKDGLALPASFAAGTSNLTDSEFRTSVVDSIHALDIVPFLFNTIKEMCESC